MINKITFWINLFIVLLIPFCCISCNVNKLPSDFPVQEIPTENINTFLEIYIPYGWNDFIIGSPIAIEVINIGDEIISAPVGFNIQCYSYSDSKWNLIQKKKIERMDGHLILRPSNGNPLKTSAVVIFPIIKNASDPIQLRIVITGNIFRDGKPTDIRVGAFIDVTLYSSTEY